MQHDPAPSPTRIHARTHARAADLPPPALTASHLAQGLCWAVATGTAMVLMIRVGTVELAGSPWAVAGLLLLGVGLVKQARAAER